MNLILHIGNHKTGSTAIQSVLASSNQELIKYGVLYPRTGRVGGAHHLFAKACMSTRNASFETFMKQFDSGETELDGLINGVASELTDSNCDTAIISSEEFFNVGLLDDRSIDHFLSFFSNLTIICVLRNQIDHIESAYKFSVAWNASREQRIFSEFLKANLNSEYHSYLATLDYWSNKAINPIKCLSFDIIKTDLIRNFLAELEITSFDYDQSIESKNKSLDFETINLMRYLNQKGVDNQKVNALVDCFQQNRKNILSSKAKKTFYSKKEFEFTKQRFFTSNNAILTKYGINLNSTISIHPDLIFNELETEKCFSNMEDILNYVVGI